MVCKVLLRDCKVDAVVFGGLSCYNESTKSRGVHMKLSEKRIALRKEKGWSQEDFAEKLDVSRPRSVDGKTDLLYRMRKISCGSATCSM